ncbi:hypothetical protein DER45DRAFT_510669 [Fusarium avenaceum]|nr:hypothetical protein DER45DRAFT_510669 [Fusarium avenaceum]
MNSNNTSQLGTVEVLDTEHRQAFEQVLARVMGTNVALQTFAQIIDGLSTYESYAEFHWPQDGHPATHHPGLCSGVLDKACEFRSAFLPESLSFQLPLLSAFEETTIGSKGYHLRMLELLAVSCHQIAVYLHQRDGTNHKHIDFQKWIDEPRDMTRWDSFRHPSAFCHTFYTDVEQYPSGAADVTGYWAEAKIFGGVLLFDRGESETECKELYLHAGRRGGPYNLFPLTTDQFQTLIEFLLGDPDSADSGESPFPFRASSKNRWRWDDWDAIARYHIFRDKYERYFQPTKPPPNYRSSIDWPEIADDLYLIDAMHEHWNGRPVDKDEIRAALERLKQVTPSSPAWHNRETRHSWTDVLFK